MKLPNAENAVIDIEKLRGYCLSPTHPKGKHKARLFRKKLCMEIGDAEILRQPIQKAIFIAEATERKPTAHGRIFRVDFMAGRGKGIIWYEAKIRSGWVIRNDEDFPHLTTCFNPNKSR